MIETHDYPPFLLLSLALQRSRAELREASPVKGSVLRGNENVSMSQSNVFPKPLLEWLARGPVELLGDTSFSFQITFRREHLEACILSLGCDVMARERSNFETYSMCYEHILQHTRQKLSQKEQVGAQRSAKERACGHGGPRVTRQRKSEWGEERCSYAKPEGHWCPPPFLSIGFFSWTRDEGFFPNNTHVGLPCIA